MRSKSISDKIDKEVYPLNGLTSRCVAAVRSKIFDNTANEVSPLIDAFLSDQIAYDISLRITQ